MSEFSTAQVATTATESVESQNMPEVQAYVVISHAGSSRNSDSSHRDASVSPGERDRNTLRERLGLQPREQISSMEESEQHPSSIPFTTGVPPLPTRELFSSPQESQLSTGVPLRNDVPPLPSRELISSPEESQLPAGVPFTTDLPGHGPGVGTNTNEDDTDEGGRWLQSALPWCCERPEDPPIHPNTEQRRLSRKWRRYPLPPASGGPLAVPAARETNLEASAREQVAEKSASEDWGDFKNLD